MNEGEYQTIGQIRRETITMAALLGVAGVLCLYVPQYLWAGLFMNTQIPIFKTLVFSLPLISILYGILLVYLEVYLLMYINLRAIRIIMAVCQFPRVHDPQYERHLYAMTEAAMDNRHHGILQFSTNPFISLPRWGLSLFFLFNKFKAALSTLTLRWVFRQLPTGYTLPSITISLAGIPFFALWNAVASAAVIHEAKVRIMAPLTIRGFVDEIYEEWGHNELFCSLIPEALAFISIQNRQYNYAHLLLTEELMDRFGLLIIRPEGRFLERVQHVPDNVRQGLERLIVFGALIDGRLSRLEKRRLRQLKANGWLTYPIADIEAMGRQFIQGKGLWV